VPGRCRWGKSDSVDTGKKPLNGKGRLGGGEWCKKTEGPKGHRKGLQIRRKRKKTSPKKKRKVKKRVVWGGGMNRPEGDAF